MPPTIPLAVDGHGRPGCLLGTAGPRPDRPQAKALLTGRRARSGIADNASDQPALIEYMKGQGATPVIPGRAGRRVARPYDRTLYKPRNWIERTFNRRKHCPRLASRYARKTAHFLACLHLAAFALWQHSMPLQPSPLTNF